MKASLFYTIAAHFAVFVIVVQLLAFVFENSNLPHPYARRFMVAIAATYLFWFFT